MIGGRHPSSGLPERVGGQVVGGETGLDHGGDGRAAEDGADLPNGVVDTGAGPGQRLRQVAGGCGGQRRPHAGVGEAEHSHRQAQQPHRR